MDKGDIDCGVNKDEDDEDDVEEQDDELPPLLDADDAI